MAISRWGYVGIIHWLSLPLLYREYIYRIEEGREGMDTGYGSIGFRYSHTRTATHATITKCRTMQANFRAAGRPTQVYPQGSDATASAEARTTSATSRAATGRDRQRRSLRRGTGYATGLLRATGGKCETSLQSPLVAGIGLRDGVGLTTPLRNPTYWPSNRAISAWTSGDAASTARAVLSIAARLGSAA